MKPFDLEAALKGELVVLRDGKIAQVMCDLNNNKLPQANSTFFHPIITIGEDLCIYLHKKNGKSWLGYNNKDIIGMYEKTHPLRDAKVDDPVMVRGGGGAWLKYHFHSLDSDGTVNVFAYGRTSWSGGDDSVTFEEFRLPTEEELRGEA